MSSRNRSLPGDLVYVSRRKLHNCAAHLGIKTGSLEPDLEVRGTVGAEVGIPSLGSISAEGTARGTRIDDGAEEQHLHALLRKVVSGLGEIPNLEESGFVREGQWFRFHRDLRFGVGHSDAMPQIKALVMVDRQPIGPEQVKPALLMNGSIAHVRDPYATAEIRTTPGSRSGSGTDRLFNWLEEFRQAAEGDAEGDAAAIRGRTARAPRSIETALSMYRLFAEERWMQSPMAEPLMHGAPCEGVAQASMIIAGDETTLVMGSPLYVQVRNLGSEPDRGSRLSRLLGRSSAQ
jgi:hypothetical protein